jgi:hypothetical protein
LCEQNGEEPPCADCLPQPTQRNVDAFRVFEQCRTQVIAGGMGDIIAINDLAVKLWMDLLHVQNQLDCMKRVRTAFTEYRVAIKESTDAQSEN